MEELNINNSKMVIKKYQMNKTKNQQKNKLYLLNSESLIFLFSDNPY